MARTFHRFDIIIIGGGTAGLSAMQEARKHTDNIVLIDSSPGGTTCARLGCMPAQSLVHAANLYHSRLKMADTGIRGTENLKPDIAAILRQVRDKRDYFVASVQEGLEKLKTQIIDGVAQLEKPSTVRLEGQLLHGKAVIIATGSTPNIPAFLKGFEDRIITTDTLFEQKNLPKRMGVLGLGPVGLELAQALARLGISVTAINNDAMIGGISDTDIAAEAMALMEKEMRIWIDPNVKISKTDDGILLKNSDGQVREVDKLLVCTGRVPQLGSLNLKKAGVPVDNEGNPHYNRFTMQIGDLPLYIAGDATDEMAILHEASDEGKRAGYHAATGNTKPGGRKVPLKIVFTDPNIALVGDSLHSMRHGNTIIGEISFADLGRATIEDERKGKIRIYADADGTLLSCELLAPQGEHLAHLIASAIEHGFTAKQMLRMPFYHPTMEEGVKKALASIVKQIKKKAT